MTLHAPSYAGGFASPERGLIDRSLWDGVVGAWYPSLGATGLTVRDHSGRGNHGTVTGMTAAEAWADPAGMTFDGVDDYVEVAASDSLDITGEITMSCWVKSAAAPSGLNEGIVGKYRNQSPDTNRRAYELFSANTSGYLGISLSNNGGYKADGTLTSTTVITDGSWHHVVGTFSPSNYMRLHVDGVLVAEDTTAILASIASNSTPVWIGTHFDLSNPNAYFGGSIDDVIIYSRALPASSVADLYRLGPGGIYRRQQHNVKAPAAGRINSLIGVGGGMIGQGGGIIGRGY